MTGQTTDWLIKEMRKMRSMKSIEYFLSVKNIDWNT